MMLWNWIFLPFVEQNDCIFVFIFICSYTKPWRKKKFEIFIFDQNLSQKSKKKSKKCQKMKILTTKCKPLLELKNGRKIIFFVSECNKGVFWGNYVAFLAKRKKLNFLCSRTFFEFFQIGVFSFSIFEIWQKMAYLKKFKKRSRAQKIQFFSFGQKRDIVPSEYPLLHSETKKMIFRPFLSSNSGLHLVVKIFIFWHFLDFFLLFWLKFWSKMKISNFFFLHGLV